MNRKFILHSGIGLIEVIAALAISVIVVTSLVSLSIFTLRSSLNSKLLLEGSRLANREIELVRAYRDQSVSWSDFITAMQSCNVPCHMDFSIDADTIAVQSGSYTEGSGLQAVTRRFTATNPNGGPIQATDQLVRITVQTSWTIAGQNKNSFIYTDLTNWRNN